MNEFDREILNVNQVICDNIAKKEALGIKLLSQNIISQLRNFVEAISLKIYSMTCATEVTYYEKQKALRYVKSRDDLTFLRHFHNSLQVTAAHSTMDPESSSRMMWQYLEYMYTCRSFVNNEFGLDVLCNLDELELENEQALAEYHRKIAEVLNRISTHNITKSPTDRFYIYKKRPFRFKGETYYELTLSNAYSSAQKTDRIIAFSKLNIPDYYAVHLEFEKTKIEIINHLMEITVVVAFSVSVRPCEFDNFNSFFGRATNVSTSNIEYRNLMSYLTDTGMNLTDFLSMSDKKFDDIRNYVCGGAKSTPVFVGLQRCREFKDQPGYNVLTYLLYRLNNKVLRDQYRYVPNDKLSGLYLEYGCIPFDVMPFANDLRKHSTRLYDLLNCIDATGREHEFLGRYIKNNTEINAKLYTPIGELEKFKDVPKLIERYNDNVYYKHRPNGCICLEDGFAFIKGYEANTVEIVNRIKNLAQGGIVGYNASVQSWLNESGYYIDSTEKRGLLENMFETSKVALIYGSAGTGKSTMIKHVSAFFADKKRLYLANTHTAVDNLRRIVKGDSNQFKTVKKCISNEYQDCDILIIDECSTISNADMLNVLNNVAFKLLILVGDIYQIESIKFGNWFSIAKEFVPKSAICELTYVHRSSDTHLKKLWDSVRKLDGTTQALLESRNYCSPLSETIFEKTVGEDEIVLCLNYDGLYGINNINRFLQDGLSGKSVEYGLERYKVGDPVIFIETDRFGGLLYNNLKGTIVDICDEEIQIKFTVEVDKALNSFDVDGYSLSLESPMHANKSVVSFYVGKFVNVDDEDRRAGDIVPFRVAHAVSIHKAQGLEYDSVKIVITDEVGELISHNIFYTAITRAKSRLKIYWSAETEKKILEGMHIMFNKEDAAVLNKKFKLKA